jgi:hypothetical protein
MWLWLSSNPRHRWAQVSLALGGAARGAQEYGPASAETAPCGGGSADGRRAILYVLMPGMDG